jgi:hypothetical protein
LRLYYSIFCLFLNKTFDITEIPSCSCSPFVDGLRFLCKSHAKNIPTRPPQRRPGPLLLHLARRQIPSLPEFEGFFRRFLHRRAIYHSATRLPEFLSLPVGDKLREKLRSINITGDHLRLDGLSPPAKEPDPSANLVYGMTVNGAKGDQEDDDDEVVEEADEPDDRGLERWQRNWEWR